MSYQIQVQYVNPSRTGGARATVKDTNGNNWGVPSTQLGYFHAGQNYVIQTEEKEYNGRRFSNILHAVDGQGQQMQFNWGGQQAPAPQMPPPSGAPHYGTGGTGTAVPPPPMQMPLQQAPPQPTQGGSYSDKGIRITAVAILKSGLEGGHQQYSEEAILENLPWLKRVAEQIERM